METQLVALAALVALTIVVGVLWRSQQGRVRTAPAPAEPAVDWSARGVDLGETATFVQFSAQVCAPCRATSRVLHDLTAARPGVAHHELDVEEHLDLVRELGVLKTPTVLVLGPDGAQVARSSGGMSPAQARDGLAAVAASSAPAEH